MTGPPRALLDGLTGGPSLVTGVEWHDEIDSTMRRAAALAAEGRPEGWVVLADRQHAGHGRRGRPWSAPPGTSLLCSILLRPAVEAAVLPLLPLLAGLAVAEAAGPHAGRTTAVTLKWPNDVLAAGRKTAGILVEGDPGRAVVLGIGLNVDWRGVERPADLAAATSLAEVAGGPVDRWRVLAALLGVFGNRYGAWQHEPAAFLDDYRARCVTIGREVRITLPGRDQPLVGLAGGVGDDGTLLVRDGHGRNHTVSAGDVEHLRPVS